MTIFCILVSLFHSFYTLDIHNTINTKFLSCSNSQIIRFILWYSIQRFMWWIMWYSFLVQCIGQAWFQQRYGNIFSFLSNKELIIYFSTKILLPWNYNLSASSISGIFKVSSYFPFDPLYHSTISFPPLQTKMSFKINF